MTTPSRLFSQDLLKIAVADMLRIQGLDKANSQCVLLLVDIVERYMSKLAQQAQRMAEESGRTHVNYLDLLSTFSLVPVDVQSLEDYIKALNLQKTKMQEKLKGKEEVGATTAAV
ncbi:hypothetical protein EDD86DRAFT_243649 [Gorgonomyces haynaldii]|nr:hypothetical protein EDD86DRAFT_243649 [Gorgonomyces haynaldii]